MSRTFIAAALAALFSTGAVYANDRTAAHAGAQAQSAQHERLDLGKWDRSELRNGLSLETLIGVDVRGQNGNSLGEVEDVVLSRDGKAKALIVSAGGVLGVGETYFRVPWNQVQIGRGLDHVKVPIAERNVDQFRWDAGRAPIKRSEVLARAIMDSSVALRDGMRYGDIDDLIVGGDGRVKALVVGSVTNGNGYYAIPFRGNLAFNSQANQYRLPYTRDEIATARMFDYSEAGIARPGVGASGGAAGGWGGFFGFDSDDDRQRNR